MEKTAFISDIQHFSIHDGPGIRTTVFFKGCPLRCRWCHNPETINAHVDILFYEQLCDLCGACVKICPEKCFCIIKNLLEFNRTSCTLCKKCIPVCPRGALESKGVMMSLSEIFTECMIDQAFYRKSGGVTFSGGEPLLQADAVFPLMELLKRNGVNLVLDTCGYVDFCLLERSAQFVDLFYYDCKCFNSDLHRRWTGVSNEKILKNLIHLLRSGANVVVRIPVIPDFNDIECEMEKIAEFLKPFSTVTSVELLAYHNLGSSKYQALGWEYPLENLRSPDSVKMDMLENCFRKAGLAVKSPG